MPAIAFDTLEYFEKLTNAGMPEAQAKVQADAMRAQAKAQADALQAQAESQAAAFAAWANKLEQKNSKELATKGDIAETNSRLRETELRLQKEIEQLRNEIYKTKNALLVWQWGIAVALAVIMAKGFGWLGF